VTSTLPRRVRTGSRTAHAEFVLPGHPDKLCDAVADAIVGHMMRGDRLAQCGIEVACVFDRVFLTGRIAGAAAVLEALDVEALVRRSYREAGYGEDAAGRSWGPSPDALRIETAFCRGEFEPGEREHRHYSDDQAVCVGHADAAPDTGHLPPAHWLARRIGRELFRLRRERGAGEVGPDGKVLVQVRLEGDAWRPSEVSISLNHHEGSDWLALRRLAEEALETACAGRALPGLTLNGAGMFVAGGPSGDNGTTGKKLAVDAYGPTVPIGGGAWSGKDFNKVDRAGGMLARRMARRWALEHGEAATVELAYVPGGREPQAATLRAGGRERTIEPGELAGGWPLQTAQVAGLCIDGLAVEPPELARWGHFGEAGRPWE
jgi:S-adenosylmethionine synthetase